MNLSQFSLIPIRYLIETNKQAFPEVFLFDVSTGPDLSDAAASICSDYGWSHDTCIALAEAFGAIRKIYSDLYSRFNTDYPLGEMTTLELAVPLGSRLFVDRVKYLRGSGTTWVQDYAAMLCAELSVLGKDAIAIAATLIDLIYECEANLQFEHAGMTHPTSDETDFPRFESIYVPRVDHATEKSRALLLKLRASSSKKGKVIPPELGLGSFAVVSIVHRSSEQVKPHWEQKGTPISVTFLGFVPSATHILGRRPFKPIPGISSADFADYQLVTSLIARRPSAMFEDNNDHSDPE